MIFCETFQCVIILVIISSMVGNLYVSFPLKRALIDDKFILYATDEQYLVSECLINDFEISTNLETLQLISKETGNLSVTDNRVIYSVID